MYIYKYTYKYINSYDIQKRSKLHYACIIMKLIMEICNVINEVKYYKINMHN